MIEKVNDSRLNDMLERYGEACKQTTAAQILGIVPRTVYRMLEEGRLRRAGKWVDVRSIYDYIAGETKPIVPAVTEEKPMRKRAAGNRMSSDDFMIAARIRRRA